VARRDLVAASRQLPKELFGETRGQPYRKKTLPSESGQGQDRACCRTGGCATIRMSRANLPTCVIVPRAKLERIEGKCRDAAANTVAKYQTVKLLPPLVATPKDEDAFLSVLFSPALDSNRRSSASPRPPRAEKPTRRNPRRAKVPGQRNWLGIDKVWNTVGGQAHAPLSPFLNTSADDYFNRPDH
jgi:hypothetical protein